MISSTSSTVPEKPSKGPSVTFTFSPTSNAISDLGISPPSSTWLIILATSASGNGVGLPWAHGKPTPLPDAEVARIINQVEEGGDIPRSLIAFEVGEKVNVTDGPFEGFSGTVEEVDDINSRLKLTVSIFGRATPVELEFTQVQKQN